ncbi:MAG: AAA family ATPase [Bacteroidales bacterium]
MDIIQISKDIKRHIEALYFIVHISTPEERKAIEVIEATAGLFYQYFDLVMDIYYIDGTNLIKPTRYPRTEESKEAKRLAQCPRTTFQEVLDYIKSKVDNAQNRIFFVLFDFPKEDTNESYLRAIKNIIDDAKSKSKTITFFFVSRKFFIPDLFEKETVSVDIPYPSRQEIGAILSDFLHKRNVTLSQEVTEEVVSALQGLTEYDIEKILNLCSINENIGAQSVKLIIRHKEQAIKKGGLLEYIKLEEEYKLGGLADLQKWLKRKSEVFSRITEAEQKKVSIPKGVFLFGMPGCGKSMAAKLCAQEFKIPLLRLDIGKIMGPYLGQSEENFRNAIKLAESIAPCVLWIDEIEKALSGVSGNSSYGTHDTSVRIFGTMLTWMQEKTAPVFVFATANNIDSIPPEFMRKGRFDELFFIDFPSKDSLKEIFEIHLKKRNWYSNQDLDKVIASVPSNKEYSGADIESVVVNAIEESFIENKSTVSEEQLIKILKETKPISETFKGKINDLRSMCEKFGITKVR